MSDTRITSKSASAPLKKAAPVAAPAAPTAAPAPAAANDSLATTRPAAPATDPKAILEAAVAIPPRPTDEAAERTWLLDGYKRLLTAHAAEQEIRKEWTAGKIDGNAYQMAGIKVSGLERELKKAGQHDAVKKEFFEGILVPAQALLDDLDQYPQPPKDKAGKLKWLEGARQTLAKANAADELLRDAWFRFDALEFGKMAESSRDRFHFENMIGRVEYELNPPPKPKPGAKGKAPAGGPGRPLFELTQQAQKGLDSKNPIGQTAGAIAMPIALTIDVIDMITRPFQWMDSLKNNK